MIKFSVLYPNAPGATFDIAYYCDRHIPMVRAKLGPALKDAAVDHGLAGGTPGSAPTYIAMGHLYFESVEAFFSAFGPHAPEIVADVPNYTNVQPVLQISDVRISSLVAGAPS